MDLQSLLTALQLNNSQIQDVTAGIQGAFGAATGAIQGQQQTVSELGQNAATVRQVEQQGMLQAQQNTRDFAAYAGSNMDVDTEIMRMLGSQLRTSATSMLDQQRKVDQIDANSSLSNPLGLMYDLVFGGFERDKLEAAKEKVNTVAGTLDMLNRSTQQTAATQQAIAATKNEASVAATTRIELLQAQQAHQQLQERLATTQVQMLGQLNSLNSQQTDNAYRMYQAVATEEQRMWGREQRELDRQERQARLQDKKETETTLEGMRTDYNAAAGRFGSRPVGSIAELKQLLQRDEQRTMFLIDRGYELQATDGERMKMGDTPTAALGAIQAYNVKLPEAQQQVASRLLSLANGISPEAIQTAMPSINRMQAQAMIEELNDPKKRGGVLDTYLTARYNQDATNFKLSDSDNMLALPTLAALNGKDILYSNPFLDRYVRPDVMASGELTFDPGKYVALALQDIQSGKMKSSDVAEGMAAVFQQLQMEAYASRNYAAFGLPPVDLNTLSAPVTLPGRSSFSNITKRVVLGNATAWNELLLEYVATSSRPIAGNAFSQMLRN